MSQTDNAKVAAREATTRTLNSAAAMYMADEDASDALAGSGNELSAATTAAEAYASLVAADLIQPLDAETQALFDAATAPQITYNATDKLFTFTAE